MSTPIPTCGNKTPEQLKVTELRDELRKRGLNWKGLKKDLVERLDRVLREEASQNALSETEASPEVETYIQEKSVDEEDEQREEPSLFPEVENAKVTVEGCRQGDSKAEPEQEGPKSRVPPIIKYVEEESALKLVSEEATIELKVELPADSEALQVKFTSDVEPLQVLDSSQELEGRNQRESVIGSRTLMDCVSKPEPENDSEVRLPADTSFNEATSETRVPVQGEELMDTEQVITHGGEDSLNTDNVVEPGTELLPNFEYLHGKPSPTAPQALSTKAFILGASDGEEVLKRLPAEVGPISEMVDGGPEEGRLDDEGLFAVNSKDVTVTTLTETVTFASRMAEMGSEEDADASRACEVGSPKGVLDAGSLSSEKKEVGYLVSAGHMDAEESGTVKELKPRDIDSEALTGGKRREGAQAWQQEPVAKRHRRWNSERRSGAGSEEKSSAQSITADTAKDLVIADSLEGGANVSVTCSPSATSRNPAAGSLEKPAVYRHQIGRLEPSLNGEAENRHVPPSSRSATNSLKIERFVRPFTNKAVRELLEQTGRVEDMWMDQIKTHCFVTYSSREEAVATRNALYNLQWPVAGGKLLVAEFVEQEEVKLRVNGFGDKPTATPAAMGTTLSSTVPTGTRLPPSPPLPPLHKERVTKRELEPPIPTLDDLFKKTLSRPQIYFLPLKEDRLLSNKEISLL